MSFPMRVKLFGIIATDYEIDGKNFQATEFHIPLDIKGSANKVTLGTITRGFKMGDATEINKWMHLADKLGDGKHIECEAEFDMVASKVAGKDVTELQLKAIKPVSAKA